MSLGDRSGGSSLLLEFFGDTPLFRIVDFLLDNRLQDFTKKDIARGSEIGWTTLYKYWNRLEEKNVVKVTRQIGRIRLYQLNETSPLVKEIKRMEMVLIKEAAPEEIENHRKAVKAVA